MAEIDPISQIGNLGPREDTLSRPRSTFPDPETIHQESKAKKRAEVSPVRENTTRKTPEAKTAGEPTEGIDIWV